jgi:hypothetical protein
MRIIRSEGYSLSPPGVRSLFALCEALKSSKGHFDVYAERIFLAALRVTRSLIQINTLLLTRKAQLRLPVMIEGRLEAHLWWPWACRPLAAFQGATR